MKLTTIALFVCISFCSASSDNTDDLLKRWVLNRLKGNITFKVNESILSGNFELTLTYRSIGSFDDLILYWPENAKVNEIYSPFLKSVSEIKDLEATVLRFSDQNLDDTELSVKVNYEIDFEFNTSYLVLERFLPEIIPINMASQTTNNYAELVQDTYELLLSENYWKSFNLENSELKIEAPSGYVVATSFGDRIESSKLNRFAGKNTSRVGAIVIGAFETETVMLDKYNFNLFYLTGQNHKNERKDFILKLLSHYLNAMGKLSSPYEPSDVNIIFLPMESDLAFQRTILFNENILTTKKPYEVHSSVSHEVVHQWLGHRSYCDTTKPGHIFIIESLVEYIADYLIYISAKDAIYAEKIKTDLAWFSSAGSTTLKDFNSQVLADIYVGYVVLLREFSETDEGKNLVDIVVKYIEFGFQNAGEPVEKIALLDVESFVAFLSGNGLDINAVFQ